MGAYLSRRREGPKVSLSVEGLEEYRMLSGFQATDIAKLYSKFMDVTYSTGILNRESFLGIPEIEENPLAERLAIVFGLKDSSSNIEFRQFLTILSQLSPVTPKDQKLKVAFAMYDMDGDGKISHKDLLDYFTLTVKFQGLDPKESVKTLAKVVGKVMNEASSHPQKHYLSLEDFSQVLNTVEGWEQRMILRIV